MGKAAKQAAPVVGMVPGVGTALGAAIGAGGSILSGGNMRSHVGAGIQGAMSGMGPKFGGGGLRIPGLPAGVSTSGFTSAAQPGIMSRFGDMARANAPKILGALSNSGGGGQAPAEAPRTGLDRWTGPLMDLFKRPGALEAGANLAGGYLEGKAAGKIADEDRKWDREKFARTQGLDEGAAAVGLGRELSMAPMKDQAMYMLQQRMGLSPGAFKPRDMFNESTSSAVPQIGGIDLEEWKRRNAEYTAGKGGLNTDIQRLLLQKLGYGGAGNA